MKTALCHYQLANIEHHLYLYLDPKIFEGILPILTETQQDQFIRQICDSLAMAIPQDIVEKHLYIKKAYRRPDSQDITLFCTDGFLVDSAFNIPVHELPFQNERIQIKETEQLSNRIKLNNDIIKTINQRLPSFEEEEKKIFSIYSLKMPSIKKEEEKTRVRTRIATEDQQDKLTMIFAEINIIKKEILEISQSKCEMLTDAIDQMNAMRNKLNDLVFKEMTDISQENKEQTKQAIDEECSELTQITAMLKQKMDDIAPIDKRFNEETKTIYQEITQEMEQFGQFKRYLIEALYAAAKTYSQVFSKAWPNVSANEKKVMIHEFNRKFSNIAYLKDSGELSDIGETLGEMMPVSLSMEALQSIVSNEDKDKLGLLQKCNTSWVEESPELKIVLKELGKLNALYRTFFQEDSRFSTAEMIQIIRVPFPRSFQFKFSDQAYRYRKSVDDFCKSRKDVITQSAQTYKRMMQLNEIMDKVNRTLREAENMTTTIRASVNRLKTVLQETEGSHDVFLQAEKTLASLKQMQLIAQQYKEKIDENMPPKLNILKRKMDELMQEVDTEVLNASQVMHEMLSIKSQVDRLIREAKTNSAKWNAHSFEDKMKQAQENNEVLNACMKKIDELSRLLKNYQEILSTEQLVASYNIEGIKKQHQEVKSVILNLIRQQNQGYGSVSDERKTRVVDLYSQIDTSVGQILQESKEAIRLRDDLLKELNKKSELTEEALLAKREPLKEKIQMIEAAMRHIMGNLAEIKKSV